MFLKKSWKHIKTGTDGKCIIFGVNIFDYKWNNTGEKVEVIDPYYLKKHIFNVYTIDINGISKVFAAGEFSNCVWGFYSKK